MVTIARLATHGAETCLVLARVRLGATAAWLLLSDTASERAWRSLLLYCLQNSVAWLALGVSSSPLERPRSLVRFPRIPGVAAARLSLLVQGPKQDGPCVGLSSPGSQLMSCRADGAIPSTASAPAQAISVIPPAPGETR